MSLPLVAALASLAVLAIVTIAAAMLAVRRWRNAARGWEATAEDLLEDLTACRRHVMTARRSEDEARAELAQLVRTKAVQVDVYQVPGPHVRLMRNPESYTTAVHVEQQAVAVVRSVAVPRHRAVMPLDDDMLGDASTATLRAYTSNLADLLTEGILKHATVVH